MPQHLNVTHIPGAHAIAELEAIHYPPQSAFQLYPEEHPAPTESVSACYPSFLTETQSANASYHEENVMPSLSEARNAAELTALETLSRA